MNLRDIGATSFAHLLGLGAPPRAKADTDGESDGPPRTAPGAHLAGAPPAPAPKAEDAPADPPPADPQPPAEGPPAPPPADEDEEAQGSGPAAQARARERARVAAILGCPAAAANIAAAAQIATGTTLPRAQAIALLATLAPPAATAPAGRRSLDERMAGVETPALGTEPPAPIGDAAEAARILSAARRARGEAA